MATKKPPKDKSGAGAAVTEIATAAPKLVHRASHVKRQIRIDLTLGELASLSNLLAQAVGRLNEAEADKAEEISQYNADIKAHRASIDKLAQQINLGYEMREVKCPIKYNEPKVGQKTIAHPETGQPLSVEAMTEPERQESLFPEEDAARRGDKAKENLAEFKKNGNDKQLEETCPVMGCTLPAFHEGEHDVDKAEEAEKKGAPN